MTMIQCSHILRECLHQPTDLVKQSLPFSYLAVSAASTDGGSHAVQVYSDISAEWVSGDDSLTVNWTTTTTGNILTHQVQLETQSLFTEVSDRIQREHQTCVYPGNVFSESIIIRGIGILFYS